LLVLDQGEKQSFTTKYDVSCRFFVWLVFVDVFYQFENVFLYFNFAKKFLKNYAQVLNLTKYFLSSVDMIVWFKNYVKMVNYD
jgi:hypothetical protein